MMCRDFFFFFCKVAETQKVIIYYTFKFCAFVPLWLFFIQIPHKVAKFL